MLLLLISKKWYFIPHYSFSIIQIQPVYALKIVTNCRKIENMPLKNKTCLYMHTWMLPHKELNASKALLPQVAT